VGNEVPVPATSTALSTSPPGNNLINATKKLGRPTDIDIIIHKSQWYQKETPNHKETILRQTTLIAFGFTKNGSPFIYIIRSMIFFV